MKLLTRVAAIFDRSIGAFAFLAAVILVFVWALISAEVILRFLVNYSIVWYMKISEFLLFATAFLGAAWLLKKEAHVKVDVVYTRLKPKAQAVLDTVMATLGVLVCLIIFWYGMKVTIDHFQRGIVTSDITGMALWPRYAIIALGSLLLVIQFCRRVYAKLMLWRMAEGKEVVPSEEKVDLKEGA